MGGEERVARQHANGRLTVRERIARLLDAGTFREIGGLTGTATYDDGGKLKDFVPTNFVTGEGRVEGRRVVVAGDDFTVRGGAADASIHEKQVYAERMAGDMGMPLIRLIDGTGGGGSVKSLEDFGRTYVPHNPGWDVVVANLAKVPVVALALGPVAGLGAARLVTSHVAIGGARHRAGLRRRSRRRRGAAWARPSTRSSSAASTSSREPARSTSSSTARTRRSR